MAACALAIVGGCGNPQGDASLTAPVGEARALAEAAEMLPPGHGAESDGLPENQAEAGQ